MIPQFASFLFHQRFIKMRGGTGGSRPLYAYSRLAGGAVCGFDHLVTLKPKNPCPHLYKPGAKHTKGWFILLVL